MCRRRRRCFTASIHAHSTHVQLLCSRPARARLLAASPGSRQKTPTSTPQSERTCCRILSSASSAFALALALRRAGSLDKVSNNPLSSCFSMYPLRFLLVLLLYKIKERGKRRAWEISQRWSAALWRVFWWSSSARTATVSHCMYAHFVHDCRLLDVFV